MVVILTLQNLWQTFQDISLWTFRNSYSLQTFIWRRNNIHVHCTFFFTDFQSLLIFIWRRSYNIRFSLFLFLFLKCMLKVIIRNFIRKVPVVQQENIIDVNYLWSTNSLSGPILLVVKIGARYYRTFFPCSTELSINCQADKTPFSCMTQLLLG